MPCFSATLANLAEAFSGGRCLFRFPPMPSISCRVYSNSSRVSRRAATRPWAACCLRLVVRRSASSASSALFFSTGSGRFFFLGGISPFWTRSKIFTHCRKVAASDRSCPSFSKFNCVSVSVSWQSMHEASISGETAALKACPWVGRPITSSSIMTMDLFISPRWFSSRRRRRG